MYVAFVYLMVYSKETMSIIVLCGPYHMDCEICNQLKVLTMQFVYFLLRYHLSFTIDEINKK